MSSQIVLNKLTAIIVDDERSGRENLKKIIENYCHEIEILGCASSAASASDLVKIHKPNVVFLDINMQILDGFDFLHEYDERNFMTVFVNAFDKYGINAVKAGAADYLLKPVNIKELKQTVKKLLMIHSKKTKIETVKGKDKIDLPTFSGFNLLVIDDIICLDAEGCYTKVVVKEGKNRIVSRTLKEFEETLPEEKFFRIHKSHLINLKYIKDYSNISRKFVTMIDGSKIEISHRKAPEFIQKIKTALKTV